MSRVLVTLASASFILLFWFPFWRIDLFAPQYPEGLTMYIWIHTLTGEVDIINGLNHYIGMKNIEPAMFPEFSYLRYVVLFFILFGGIVAVYGRRSLLLVFLLILIAAGALAMYDFYQWGYDYGHDLNPQAPIRVPGLSYQPPVLGHKRLLNFDAYSFPHIGGWVVICAGALIAGTWSYEWFRARKRKSRPLAKRTAIAAILGLLFLAACTSGPQPFDAGKDACHFCKMNLTDTRFGAELITSKGKVFKFDDLHCLAAFQKAGTVAEKDVKQLYTINFSAPNTFLELNTAVLVTSPALKSPMGSSTAAFTDTTAAALFLKDTSARQRNWTALREALTN